MTRWLSIMLLVATAPRLPAVEKHWIAQTADVINVGRLSSWPAFPWFDGWHINATIQVDEVLFGKDVPAALDVRFVFEWNSIDRHWLPPRLPEFFRKKALWFLCRREGRGWEPSVNFGILPLGEREYWKEYVRVYKR